MVQDAEGEVALSYFHVLRPESANAILYCQEGERFRPPKRKDVVIPWIADEWSLDDEVRARRLLEDHKEQCEIDPSILKDDQRCWNKFYTLHQNNFFKDRYHLITSFPDEFRPNRKTLVEMGCGVGNTLLPLLEKTDWTVFGLDLSQVAIGIIYKDPRYIARAGTRAFAQVCDITVKGNIPETFESVGDVASLLFCLSAIHPDLHLEAVINMGQCLKSGGVCVFRDYGRFDEAQIKLGTSNNKLIRDNFYCKSDGTKCYYFTVDEVKRLFLACGFQIVDCGYIRRVYTNRLLGATRRRVWVQGRFKKSEFGV